MSRLIIGRTSCSRRNHPATSITPPSPPIRSVSMTMESPARWARPRISWNSTPRPTTRPRPSAMATSPARLGSSQVPRTSTSATSNPRSWSTLCENASKTPKSTLSATTRTLSGPSTRRSVNGARARSTGSWASIRSTGCPVLHSTISASRILSRYRTTARARGPRKSLSVASATCTVPVTRGNSRVPPRRRLAANEPATLVVSRCSNP